MATLDRINLFDYQTPTPEEILQAGGSYPSRAIPLSPPVDRIEKQISITPFKDFLLSDILNPSGRELYKYGELAHEEVINPINYLGIPPPARKVISTTAKGIAGIGHNRGPEFYTPEWLSDIGKAKYNEHINRRIETDAKKGKDFTKYITPDYGKQFARHPNIDEDDLKTMLEFIESSRDPYIKQSVLKIIDKSNKNYPDTTEFNLYNMGTIEEVTRRGLMEQNAISKDGDVFLYRAINLADDQKLVPDKGLVSTTIDPNFAANLAKEESIKKINVLPEGYKPDIFETPLDRALKGIELQEEVIKRTPKIVMYKVPAKDIKAYMPKVVASAPDNAQKYLVKKRILDDRYDEVDELLESEEWINNQYTRADAEDEIISMYEREYFDDIYDIMETADLEKEALIDATDLKPVGVFELDEFTTLLDRGSF